MKKISLLAALAFLAGACSTSNKLAEFKTIDYNDDVYFSEARAREELAIVKTEKKTTEKSFRTEEELYGGADYSDYTYNDYSYSNRINRFYYYNSPFQRYDRYNRYDPWYDHYSYNSWNNFNNWYTPGLSFYMGTNPWNYNYNSYNYNSYYNHSWMYGYPYASNYWGPVSYNNYYPGGYGYGGGGGLYNPGQDVKDPNYRARPLRGTENIGGALSGIGTIRTDGQGRIMTSPSRGAATEKISSGTTSSGRTSSTPPATERARPERIAPAPRPEPVQDYTPRQTQQAAPSSSGSSSSDGGGSSGGGSSSESSRARPSR